MIECTACSALHLGGSIVGRGGGRRFGCASLKSAAVVDELTSCAPLRAGPDGVVRKRFVGAFAAEAARRPRMENADMEPASYGRGELGRGRERVCWWSQGGESCCSQL